MTLLHFLVVSALLMAAGTMTLIVRRTPIGRLMGIELITSAAALNLIAFNHFLPPPSRMEAVTGPRLDGEVFALFIILTSALQAALALAIFLNLRAHIRGANEGLSGKSGPNGTAF